MLSGFVKFLSAFNSRYLSVSSFGGGGGGTLPGTLCPPAHIWARTAWAGSCFTAPGGGGPVAPPAPAPSFLRLPSLPCGVCAGPWGPLCRCLPPVVFLLLVPRGVPSTAASSSIWCPSCSGHWESQWSCFAQVFFFLWNVSANLFFPLYICFSISHIRGFFLNAWQSGCLLIMRSRGLCREQVRKLWREGGWGCGLRPYSGTASVGCPWRACPWVLWNYSGAPEGGVLSGVSKSSC